MAPHQTLPSSSAILPTAQSRRRKPDWAEFYKNGVPKEIIVIDDDDDDVHPDNVNSQENNPTSIRQNFPLSHTAARSGIASGINDINGTSHAAPATKRRRTGMETAIDMSYYDRPTFSIHPQQYGEDSSGTSVSTDRTASLHTTAPTSMGSHEAEAGGDS
ncbi:conserved hypothetical protein [Histoplasma capsulatum H143]|uniref:Uncharacterized protein n=1 Tax=Ajellomyces capsulatus (strain H143) TaxID=544712 RepID=C6HN86_AJECH|nr:conserved hypothetical protein [Histoplasma capsulatum H143]